MASGFDDPVLPGQMTTTAELEETIAGTRLTVTQEGLPMEIPAEFAQQDWQESLELLRLLVEPDIPSLE